MIVWRNEIVVKNIIRIPISFLVGIFLGDSTVFIHLLLFFLSAVHKNYENENKIETTATTKRKMVQYL